MSKYGHTTLDTYEAKRTRLSMYFESARDPDYLSNRDVARLCQVDEKFVRKYRIELGLPPSPHVGGPKPLREDTEDAKPKKKRKR